MTEAAVIELISMLETQPRPSDEDWYSQALCPETDPDAFYPEKGGSTADAKKVCRGCPVKDQCLQWALDTDESYGVWGGLSGRERRRLKRSADPQQKSRRLPSIAASTVEPYEDQDARLAG